MICRLGDVVRRGDALSVSMAVEPPAVAAAVRRPGMPTDERIAIDCPEPSALHEAVGCIHSEMGIRTKTALARAGRTRGLDTPYDAEIDETKRELADITVDTQSLETQRERVATADAAVDQARIRAAEARGRVRERSNAGLDTAPAESELDDALRALSEAETDAIAARQAYQRDRRRQRERRDRRERKFRLEERVANLDRQARAYLVDRLREKFQELLVSVPGSRVTETEAGVADTFEADPVTTALAVARLAELRAPVVLAADRFASAEAAHAWLDAPVLHI